MANDFTDCGFGAITPELILRTLIGCVSNLAGTYTQAVLKVDMYHELMLSPVHCASYEDFQINLRRALNVSNTGLSLRVNYLVQGLDTCGLCANAITWWDYFNSLFGEDSDGVVYINVFITNSQPN